MSESAFKKNNNEVTLMSNYSFHQDRNSMTFVIHELSSNLNLSDWEKKFIKSLKQHYVVENKFLSDKQTQKLSDLWEKY